MPRQVAFIPIALLLMTAASGGQQPGEAPQGQPVFQAEVRYVEVDVFVTDRDGEFVRDLTVDDFELYEDGERQEVRTFQLVDLPIVTRTSEPAAFAPVDQDVTSNGGDGRLYVILLDSPRPREENLPQQSARAPGPGPADGPGDNPPAIAAVEGAVHAMFVQRVARRFVEEAVGPMDLVAVLHAQGGLRAAQGFTTNRRLLLESIDGFGVAGIPEPASQSEVHRMQFHTYDAIRELSDRLGAISGRRKAIIWIGGDLPWEQDGPASAAYRDAIRAATRNNVAVYPIDPRGLTTMLGQPGPGISEELMRLAALRAVAEDTGGLAVVNTNNFTGAYERIVRDNSTYYLLGYHPPVEHRDGGFRPIRVRVARPGLTVRARPGYFARDPDAEARRLPPLPEGLSALARDALRSPAPLSGLTIDLLTTPFRGEGRDGSVLLAAQLHGSDLRLEPGDRVELAYQALDADGRIATGTRKVFTLTYGPESRALVEATGLRYLDRLELPAGRHEIRFVVHQPNGSTGSVVAHLEVPDFTRTPVAMSGLVLASASTANHRTLFGDPELTASGGTNPTAVVMLPTPVREFPAGDELAVLAEIYLNGAVRAEDVRLVTLVTSEQGAIVFREEDRLASAADSTRAGYAHLLSLEGFAAGRYVLALEAHAPGLRAPVVRHVPFTVAGAP